MRQLIFCALLFMVNSAFAQKGEDSINVVLIDAVFDSTASANRYVHSSGFSVRYPYGWNRAFGQDDRLKLVLRETNPDYPANFKETVELTSSRITDSTSNVESFLAEASMQLKQTWEAYQLTTEVIDSGFVNINDRECGYLYAKISRLSQEKLIIVIPGPSRVYTIEYTATNNTFTMFLEDYWRMINSYTFIER